MRVSQKQRKASHRIMPTAQHASASVEEWLTDADVQVGHMGPAGLVGLVQEGRVHRQSAAPLPTTRQPHKLRCRLCMMHRARRRLKQQQPRSVQTIAICAGRRTGSHLKTSKSCMTGDSSQLWSLLPPADVAGGACHVNPVDQAHTPMRTDHCTPSCTPVRLTCCCPAASAMLPDRGPGVPRSWLSYIGPPRRSPARPHGMATQGVPFCKRPTSQSSGNYGRGFFWAAARASKERKGETRKLRLPRTQARWPHHKDPKSTAGHNFHSAG